MPEDKQQSSMLTMFGVIFTVIALVALIALVLVRSKAQTNTANVTQQTSTQSVAPTFAASSMHIMQGATDVGYYDYNSTYPATPWTSTPANGINLTAGQLTSTDPEFTVTITDDNSIPQAIVQPNARITVTASVDAVPHADCSYLVAGQPADGTHCVTFTYAGNATDPNRANAAIVTPATSSPTETQGTIDVAVPLPFYFAKGRVNFVFKVVPVDANGTAQDGTGGTSDLSVSNFSLDTSNFWAGDSAISYVNGMPAISVTGGPSYTGAAITYYASPLNTALTPGATSIAYGVKVQQLGNIFTRVKVAAQASDPTQAWVNNTNPANPLYMPASITHFLGETTDGVSDLTDYALATGVETLDGSTNQIEVMTPAGTTGSWYVPLTQGAADLTGITYGSRIFDTMIKIPLGSVGTYYSTLVTYGSDMSDVNGVLAP